jgi:hypothetical protein
MSLKIKRSQWILLVWPASILAILFVIWISGYVYWQIRISRAIAELKRGPAKYEQQLFYADADLLEIGSRGILRLLREWDEALSRGDEDQAFAFACGIQDLFSGASEVSGKAARGSGSYARTRIKPSMKSMRDECRQYFDEWPGYEAWFAPWWMWWEGHRVSY